MRKALIILFCVLVSILSAATELKGKVVAVIDGDTIGILCQEVEYRIRLEGIDCPELRQPFGRKAKKFTSNHVFGKMVTVLVKEKDKYGRSVGTVLYGNGRNLNNELVKAGLAWWYRHYSDDETLRKLEEEAHKARRGLWSQSGAIPPWEERHKEDK